MCTRAMSSSTGDSRRSAAGYLLKNAEADEVAAAVRAAMRGEAHL